MQGVSVAEITCQPAFSAELLSAGRFLAPLRQSEDLLLSIDVPAFGVSMAGEISDLVIGDAYQQVTFESFVDEGVSALLTIQNERSNGATSDLQIKGASISIRVKRHKPRAHFFADTLYAMLGLAGPVRISISALNIDLGLNFTRRLSEVSKFIELRQMEFGLMVIEKAAGLAFDIPEHVTGEERNSISLAYHAIVERQFIWRVNDITQPTPATEAMLSWFDSLKSVEPDGCVDRLMFGPSPATRTILGQEVSLGDETVFIDDGIIENRDDIRRELAEKDGHIVPIKIRPRSRQGRYVFSNAPRLPNGAWDEKIENFIKLEDTLNQRLAARYHELAASTVADLTPREIEALVSRPKLSEDAYLVRD